MVSLVDVPIAGLPEELHGYSIAQISDIHVGPTIRRPYLNAIVNRVNALKADAIAVTGDLVDGSVQRLALHTEPLARLSARLMGPSWAAATFRRRDTELLL